MIKKKTNGLELALIDICNKYNKQLSFEVKFHPTRRWRFDYAIEDKKICFEYEGGLWGNSRHRSSSGFLGDCEKYNNAVLLGWQVYRFTVKDFTKMNVYGTKNFIESILTLDRNL